METKLRMSKMDPAAPLTPEVKEFLEVLFFEAGVYTDHSLLNTSGDAIKVINLMVGEIGELQCRSESNIWFGALIDHPAKPGSTYADGHFYNFDNDLNISSWTGHYKHIAGWNTLPTDECVRNHMQYITDHFEWSWQDKLVTKQDVNDFYVSLARLSQAGDIDWVSTVARGKGSNWLFFS